MTMGGSRMSAWMLVLTCPGVATAAITPDATAVDFGTSPAPLNAGARAMGMSAFTAVADDATAMAANPGAMIQLERPEVSFAGGLYSTSITPHAGEDQRKTRLDLDHLSAVLPFFAFGHQQSVGVLWQRQFDFTRASTFSQHTSSTSFPAFDDTRTDSFTQTGAFSTVSVSYAIEVIPGLGVGITGSVWDDRITQNSASTQYLHIHSDDVEPDFNDEVIDDFTTKTRIRVDEGYSAVMGAWWQAAPSLTLATVVKPGYKLHLSEHVESQDSTTSIASPPSFVQDAGDSFSTLRMPTVATIAAAWRQDDEDTVAAEVSWTQWSRLSIRSNHTDSTPYNVNVPASSEHDGIAARVGYEHLFILPTVVAVARVGAFYEEQPGLRRLANLSDPPAAGTDRYYGLSTGGSLCYRTVSYDLGAQVRYGHNVGAGYFVAADDAANILELTVRLGATFQF